MIQRFLVGLQNFCCFSQDWVTLNLSLYYLLHGGCSNLLRLYLGSILLWHPRLCIVSFCPPVCRKAGCCEPCLINDVSMNEISVSDNYCCLLVLTGFSSHLKPNGKFMGSGFLFYDIFRLWLTILCCLTCICDS